MTARIGIAGGVSLSRHVRASSIVQHLLIEVTTVLALVSGAAGAADLSPSATTADVESDADAEPAGQTRTQDESLADLRRLADQGDARAETRLALRYLNGTEVVQDDAQAIQWFRKAAESGYAEAQVYLGLMYDSGNGIAPDAVQAVQWYRKAADQGLALGQFQLGLSYQDGTGIAQDHALAAQWYRKASEQGLASAQNNLGLMYTTGLGVVQDHAEAFQWYRKAADQGPADAQVNLARAYFTGAGTPKDDVEAYRWLLIAVLRSSGAEQRQYAGARDGVGQQMPPAQVAEAERRAREWLAAFAARPRAATGR